MAGYTLSRSNWIAISRMKVMHFFITKEVKCFDNPPAFNFSAAAGVVNSRLSCATPQPNLLGKTNIFVFFFNSNQTQIYICSTGLLLKVKSI